MKLILRTGLLAAMMFALAGANPAHAIFGQVGTASGCKAGKAKCVTKMKSCLLGCYGKAFGKGIAVDTACVDKCRTGFLADPATGKGCMEKLDTKNANCGATVGDAAVVRSKVEAHVAELVAALNPAGGNPLNKCLSGKTKCVSKYNACVLGIVGKAFKAGSTVGDLSKCNAILSNAGGKASCVQKLEDKNPPASATECVTFNDQGNLKNTDDVFVNDLIYGWVGGGDLASKRCVGDTATECSVDGDCGVNAPCAFYFGSPLPLSAGGVATCVTSQWNGGMSGTFNQQSGQSAGTASILSRVYNGISTSQPCPKCTGIDIPNDGVASGTCSGGAHNGAACDANGESPVPAFGYTSLDCGPTAGGLIATLPIDLTNANNATMTATLAASSPNCNGSPGDKCMCASCSGNSSVPCRNDADCIAAAAGTCTNAAGEPRKPNSCIDDTSIPGDGTACAATTAGEGACTEGPTDQNCRIESFRGCLVDADCPAAGDSCGAKARECFPGYNGGVGETISAAGKFSTPHNHTGTATFASVFCVAPTGSSSVNSVAGLPGPGRLALSGVSSEDGTDVACPTVATFLPTAKGGVLDAGWTGISHDSRIVGQGKVTVSVTSCANPTPPCGVCTYTGPVVN
ncbi:MAG: hypothetical protein IT294_09965 [Deltaproteobacteria bacterium]|nr:hypothetical protein [Deltaproteobacteria bacterium]